MKFLTALLLVLVTLTSCDFDYRVVEGSGNMVKRNLDINDFSGVKAAGPIDIEVKQASDYKVSIEADDNIIDLIIIRKEGNSLLVKLKDHIHIKNSSNIKVAVELPNLKSVDVAGSGNIRSVGTIENSDKIDVAIAGSGDVYLEVRTPLVSSSVAGAGKSLIKGETKKLDVDIAGSGDVDASGLKSEEVDVNIGGSGNVKVFASLKLDVSIAGSGDVVYYGSPEITKSVVGSGNIRKGD
jgi:hypothetical protein